MKLHYIIAISVAALIMTLSTAEAKKPPINPPSDATVDRKTPAPATVVPGKKPASPSAPAPTPTPSQSLANRLSAYKSRSDLSLAVTIGNTAYYLPSAVWSSLTKKEMNSLGKVGLVVRSDAGYFTLALNDSSDKAVGWAIAVDQFALPTKEQGRVIAERAAEINEAMKFYGGSPMAGCYWTRTEKNDNEAWQIDVDGGFVYGFGKDYTSRVRAVR